MNKDDKKNRSEVTEEGENENWVKQSKRFRKIYSKKYHGSVPGLLGVCAFVIAIYCHDKIDSVTDNFLRFEWKEQYPVEF